MGWREELIVNKLRVQGDLYCGSGLGTQRTLPLAQTDVPQTVTTTATPASGSCGVQFVFKDAGGTTMAKPISGLLYLSEASTDLTIDAADTSLAVLTNGKLTNIISHSLSHFITTAAGLLGLTITAAADDYYVVFMLPGLGGTLLISDVCTVNA